MKASEVIAAFHLDIKEPEDDLDLIYQNFDHWMRNDQWDEVKELLLVDVATIPVVLCLAILSITKVAKLELGVHRITYLDKLKEHLKSKHSRKLCLLEGLE